MLNLIFLLLQTASLDDAAASFAKGDPSAREDILKAGVSSILPLRKVRAQSPERVDALIFEIKTRGEELPAKALLDALEAARSMELGQVCFEVAVDDLSNGLPLVFDPALFRTHWGKNVTLNLKERPRREILESLCRQAGLDYGFFYGVVLIAEPGRLWPAPALKPRVTPLSAEESERASTLIQRLGSDVYQEREEAQAALKKLGTGAIPLLEKGAQGEDLERRTRCTALVRALTEPPPQAVFHRPAAAQQKLAGPDEALRKRLFSEMVSFKVADIVLDGAMKLMLQPRQVPHQLSPSLLNARVTLDAQNQTAWTLLSLATHHCGYDFMIENGKVVVDTREEIQRRLGK
jgi:hypothetical protein